MPNEKAVSHSPVRFYPLAKLQLQSDASYRNAIRACQFIARISQQLGFPWKTTCTAQVLFHRFFIYESIQETPPDPFNKKLKYSIQEMAVTCLFVGSKIEETVKKLRDILIPAIKDIYPKNPEWADFDSPQLEQWRNKIMALERELLEQTHYLFGIPLHLIKEIKHPHKLVLKMAKYWKVEKSIVKYLWGVLMECYATNIFLFIPIHCIALACFFIGSHLFPDLHWMKDQMNWIETFNGNLELIEESARIMLRLLIQHRMQDEYYSELKALLIHMNQKRHQKEGIQAHSEPVSVASTPRTSPFPHNMSLPPPTTSTPIFKAPNHFNSHERPKSPSPPIIADHELRSQRESNWQRSRSPKPRSPLPPEDRQNNYDKYSSSRDEHSNRDYRESNWPKLTPSINNRRRTPIRNSYPAHERVKSPPPVRSPERRRYSRSRTPPRNSYSTHERGRRSSPPPNNWRESVNRINVSQQQRVQTSNAESIDHDKYNEERSRRHRRSVSTERRQRRDDQSYYHDSGKRNKDYSRSRDYSRNRDYSREKSHRDISKERRQSNYDRPHYHDSEKRRRDYSRDRRPRSISYERRQRNYAHPTQSQQQRNDDRRRSRSRSHTPDQRRKRSRNSFPVQERSVRNDRYYEERSMHSERYRRPSPHSERHKEYRKRDQYKDHY